MTSEWRLSGKDGKLHAFQADGGYIVPHELVSLGFPGSVPASEVIGPYEAFIAECGHIVPTAMLLTSAAGESCLACQATTGVLTLRRTARDWNTVEPLLRRPGRQLLQSL